MSEQNPPLILGETNELLRCAGADEQFEVIVAMLAQAEREVDLLSYRFDPEVYDNEACFEAFEDLALRSRYSRIRILLHQPAEAVRGGHRVINLGRRLSSYFQFRRPAEHHRHLPQSFLIVDKIGIVQQPYQDSRRATANFCDAPGARILGDHFQRLWDEAEEDPYLRYLSL